MWFQLGIWNSHHKFNSVSSSLQSQSHIVLLQIQVPDHTQHWSSLALHWFCFRKDDFHRQKWDIGAQKTFNMGLVTCKWMTGIHFFRRCKMLSYDCILTKAGPTVCETAIPESELLAFPCHCSSVETTFSLTSKMDRLLPDKGLASYNGNLIVPWNSAKKCQLCCRKI